MAILLPQALEARIPDIKFRRLDTRDGLSNSQVICIMRDSKGFVWIGTAYGLNRYDGYRVKTFYSDIRDSTTLRSNYVDAIFETTDGQFWFKQGMSYTIFDPTTEKCDRHPERWLEARGITGGLERIYVDKEKDFWVKTYTNTFCHYNSRTKKTSQLPVGYGANDIPVDVGISSFADRGKELIISTVNGDIIFTKDGTVINAGSSRYVMNASGDIEIDKAINTAIVDSKFQDKDQSVFSCHLPFYIFPDGFNII